MSIPGFGDWLQTPQGQYLLQWEQARYDAVVADIFGFNALQIGLRECDFLRANRIPFRFRCDGDGESGGIDVLSDLQHLPFATASIDLVVLPHILEFVAGPHQVLREVERVLVPEGHVVITGFNPFSLWGFRRRMAGHGGPFPWCGNYLSVMRLRDWLALLGFETRAGSFGCYVPAVTQERWLRRWHWMESAGNRWWPFAGGAYLVRAIKRIHGMRVITPKWKERRARAQALSPAVNLNDH
jgi:SAM-dependent methyltransferase